MEGEVFSFDFPNPFIIPMRKMKKYWCAKCGRFQDRATFFRQHGQIKGCGFYFTKSSIVGKGGSK